MSDRFYKQQADYFNIKSVHELGLMHEGLIVKKEKPTTIVGDNSKRLLKADVIELINSLLPEPITSGLQVATMDTLIDLHMGIRALSNASEVPKVGEATGRLKKVYVSTVEELLSGNNEGLTLELSNLTKLTVATLKALITNLRKLHN